MQPPFQPCWRDLLYAAASRPGVCVLGLEKVAIAVLSRHLAIKPGSVDDLDVVYFVTLLVRNILYNQSREGGHGDTCQRPTQLAVPSFGSCERVW
jgi:hypothetical protein